MRIYHGHDKSEGTNVTYLGGMGENNKNNTFIDKKSWNDFFLINQIKYIFRNKLLWICSTKFLIWFKFEFFNSIPMRQLH